MRDCGATGSCALGAAAGGADASAPPLISIPWSDRARARHHRFRRRAQSACSIRYLCTMEGRDALRWVSGSHRTCGVIRKFARKFRWLRARHSCRWQISAASKTDLPTQGQWLMYDFPLSSWSWRPLCLARGSLRGAPKRPGETLGSDPCPAQHLLACTHVQIARRPASLSRSVRQSSHLFAGRFLRDHGLRQHGLQLRWQILGDDPLAQIGQDFFIVPVFPV